jgi:hypothetical protein
MHCAQLLESAQDTLAPDTLQLTHGQLPADALQDAAIKPAEKLARPAKARTIRIFFNMVSPLGFSDVSSHGTSR